jgi:hypothetical protein
VLAGEGKSVLEDQFPKLENQKGTIPVLETSDRKQLIRLLFVCASFLLV